jgi:hypothetical protein
MADEVTIRINNVSYVRNPHNEGSVASLLIRKGIDPVIAYIAEKQCRVTAPGHKVDVKVPGVTLTV